MDAMGQPFAGLLTQPFGLDDEYLQGGPRANRYNWSYNPDKWPNING